MLCLPFGLLRMWQAFVKTVTAICSVGGAGQKGKSKEFVAFNQETAYFSVLTFKVQICIKKSHLYLIGAWSSLELLAAVGHLASLWVWALSFAVSDTSQIDSVSPEKPWPASSWVINN